jgi:multisubunit Na+/H+ antiporter MnhB subunit
MAVALALSALAVLIVALVLFVRARRDAPQGTPLPNGRSLVVLTLLGLMLALASQLPVFR